jgi:hypothetical protein
MSDKRLTVSPLDVSCPKCGSTWGIQCSEWDRGGAEFVGPHYIREEAAAEAQQMVDRVAERTGTAPAGLTQEERVHLSGVRDYIANVYMVWPGAKPAWLAVIDRLLASTAPVPAGGPPLDAAQREIKTCHEMLDSNRDVLPAGLLPERLSALLADIDRMTSQLRADREVPASVMEMPMDAAARVRDGVRPAPASGGRDELGFSAFEERWANIIAEYESDDIVSDIIRPMVRESVRKVDAIEVAILAHQLAPYVKEIDAFAIVRSILGHLGIATPATAEREG